MNSRYDDFVRRQKMVQQLRDGKTDREKGIALLDLICEVIVLSRDEAMLLHPELRTLMCLDTGSQSSNKKRA